VLIFLEKLASRHKKSEFNCGIEELDKYLHCQASQDVKRSLSTAYVLADQDGEIIGYFTLSANALIVSELPWDYQRKLPPNRRVACTLLGRLAVNSKYQGEGYGRDLLFRALEKSALVSQEIASWAIIVDAIDKRAKQFYLKYGFLEFVEQSLRLFLPIKAINKLLEHWQRSPNGS
jgi:predicted GNAT family N-acyltransferase